MQLADAAQAVSGHFHRGLCFNFFDEHIPTFFLVLCNVNIKSHIFTQRIVQLNSGEKDYVDEFDGHIDLPHSQEQ